jgi:hypothetical protein
LFSGSLSRLRRQQEHGSRTAQAADQQAEEDAPDIVIAIFGTQIIIDHYVFSLII